MKRLADTFDNMLNRLEESFAAQNQFIQDASHELRTPIAIAQTNIDVLQMDENPSNTDYKQLVEVLKLTTRRMSQLSDKLLLLSRNRQQPADNSVIDIVSVVKEVLIEVNSYALNSKIDLQFHTGARELKVKGDAFAIKQAVINLIDNAIRYNHPGGRAKISLHKDDNNAIITVEDNGIGISEADQKHIFDRFFRVDKSRSRAQGGSGLGLAIVKEIAEAHHGRVTVESVTGEGSTFTISLPLYNPD
jgi:signal transduction histidine kinase